MRVVNARGFAVQTVFDGLGRPVTVTDPDGGVTTAYDAVGRVTDVTDANGTVESWVYDGLGRTVQHVDAEGGLLKVEVTPHLRWQGVLSEGIQGGRVG